MVRALLWKEWRRLRALRFTLMGIGLALPAAFSLAVWAAGHGWGMRAFSGYSVRTILLEAVPATLWLGLWPLAALVFVVQAFTADRAEGTESFLLDRAVSRRRTWLARWTASAGSLGAVAVVGVTMLVVFFAGYAESSRSARGLVFFAVPGFVLIVATSLAGLGATALLSAPLPAFLVALLLTAFPVLAGVGGSLIFPYANWQGIPVAGLAACALALVMPLASWTADTQGEPAGRGRRLRAALVLVGGLALSALGFVAIAPLAVRAGAPAVEFSVVAPLEGGTTLVTGERGFRQRGTSQAVPSVLANGPAGFLVDLADGRRRAFLAPEVQWAQWDAKGKKLAVLDNSRAFGSIGSARLRFLDAEGGELWPPIEEPENLAVQQAAWVGDRLAVLYGGLQEPTAHLDVLDPASGRQITALDMSGAWFMTLQATRDGRVFLYGLDLGNAPRTAPLRKEDWDKAVWSLRELDPANGRLGPPVLRGHGLAFGSRGLSPSGRYWKHRTRSASELFEISTGTAHPLAVKSEAEWLSDDSLVWLERGEPGWALMRMLPGGSPRSWASGPERDPLLEVSPDGAFALVSLLGPRGRGEQSAVLLRVGSEEPPRLVENLAPFRIDAIAWAGPRTLAVTRRGRLALYDVPTGKSTVVFGAR